jgi:hypothetical protein
MGLGPLGLLEWRRKKKPQHSLRDEKIKELRKDRREAVFLF